MRTVIFAALRLQGSTGLSGLPSLIFPISLETFRVQFCGKLGFFQQYIFGIIAEMPIPSSRMHHPILSPFLKLHIYPFSSTSREFQFPAPFLDLFFPPFSSSRRGYMVITLKLPNILDFPQMPILSSHPTTTMTALDQYHNLPSLLLY